MQFALVRVRTAVPDEVKRARSTVLETKCNIWRLNELRLGVLATSSVDAGS